MGDITELLPTGSNDGIQTSSLEINFYIHPQETINTTLLPILQKYLPFSNPIYNRMLAPHNTPDRHCIFAASFPPPNSTSSPRPSSTSSSSFPSFATTPIPSPIQDPNIQTILFSDRSRPTESQIWIFNTFITDSYEKPLSRAQDALLATHMKALLMFLRHLVVCEASGYPFGLVCKLACLHDVVWRGMRGILGDGDEDGDGDEHGGIKGEGGDEKGHVIKYATNWNTWIIPTIPSPSSPQTIPENPTGISVPNEAEKSQRNPPPYSLTLSRIPEEFLHVVISSSSIHREIETLKMQPSLCLIAPGLEREMMAWAFVGVDGSLATLYVQPTHRNRGLATYISRELVTALGRGEFSDLGFIGESGFVHAEVGAGNRGSEEVMRALKGEVLWGSWYVGVDLGGGVEGVEGWGRGKEGEERRSEITRGFVGKVVLGIVIR